MAPLGKIVGRTKIGVGRTGPESASTEIVNESSSCTIPCGIRVNPPLSKTLIVKVVPLLTALPKINISILVSATQVKLCIKMLDALAEELKSAPDSAVDAPEAFEALRAGATVPAVTVALKIRVEGAPDEFK